MITKRLDRVQRVAPEFLSETPPVPISVKIELSPRCNYRCKYCALMDRKNQPIKDMDWHLFQDMTEEMVEIGVEEIGPFFIGESFMNPELLVKSIRHLKEIGTPYIFLTSNGSKAIPEVVSECMAVGLDSLKWSCNAADRMQFEEMMGVHGKAFDRANDNIRDASSLRKFGHFQTKLYASSIEYDAGQRSRMAAYLGQSVLPYVDQHYWLPLYSMAGFATDREGDMGLKPVAGNTGRCDDPVAPIPCWLLFTSGHVMADGQLTACGYDAVGNWTVGDLREQSFMEAWHSRDFRELRRAHLAGDITGTKCEKCLLLG